MLAVLTSEQMKINANTYLVPLPPRLSDKKNKTNAHMFELS
eukprot:XP_001706135.1 Hypothetical protein GL50803_7860 [Giardia lamblia ATCC 50803]